MLYSLGSRILQRERKCLHAFLVWIHSCDSTSNEGWGRIQPDIQSTSSIRVVLSIQRHFGNVCLMLSLSLDSWNGRLYLLTSDFGGLHGCQLYFYSCTYFSLLRLVLILQFFVIKSITAHCRSSSGENTKHLILQYTDFFFFVFQNLNIQRNSRMRVIQETGKKMRILAFLTNANREFRDYVAFLPTPLKEGQKLTQFQTQIRKNLSGTKGGFYY